ncbi:peptidoglycan-binding protein [Labrenzia sp. DG1229]|uniref:peptidoglycan-binding protein n=1 Tax=Labrenzia sp. DG1229 TaxID=681847 RepID=UPI00055B48C5|nr:peptidoglycan-binding protein [Labrenzia sp. DG1229]
MFRSSLACLLTLCSLPALADVWTFETPSENIQCTVGEGFDENEQAQSDITCTIIERSGPPALPRPNDCASGWGHVFSMRNRGPVQMECGAPSQDRGGSSRAEYGVTGEFVGITCHSSRQGLTCTNRDGNGFSLAKRRQAVFGPNVEQSAGPGSPKTISRAAAYLRDEQIGVACDGRGGTFEPGGLIERDLTGDGKDDLLIDHRGISCNGSPRSSLECGMQVCSMRIYVREGQLLQLKEDFLGMQPSIGNEQVPVIRVLGHGGGQAAIRWTGYGFERLQQPVSASNARPAYDPNARWGSYTGQGIREASVTSGPQNQLLLACDPGASPFGAGSSLSIEIGGDKAPGGSTGTMAFDGGQPIPVHFNADNSVQVENSNASIGQFNFIVSSLKRHSTVLVSLPNGKQVRFSLRGSSRAIGNCPATPTARDLTAATAAAARPAASSKQGSGGSDNKFADYPPTAILNSAAKFPQFNGRDNAFRDYRTRLRDGVNAGVNFAGHYSFVTIGCGTSCRFAFVVDLRSGEVFDFPYGGEEQYQMDLLFFRDSRLVKVRWKGSWDGNTCSERDLAVEGTRWRVLAERTVPAVDDFCFYDPEEVENRGQFNDRDVSGTSSDTGPVTQPAPALQIENVAKDASPAPGTGQGPAAQTIAGSEGYEEDLRNQNQSHERYLKILGFDPGPVDGVTDASTTAAIIAFQQTNGLEVLGRLSPEHIGLLERQTEATLMAMAAPPSDALKVQNQKRWKLIEQYLNDLGFDPGAVDGDIDNKTRSAVNAFQKKYGLNILNDIPEEHFAVLEALATPRGNATQSAEEADTQIATTSPETQKSTVAKDQFSSRVTNASESASLQQAAPKINSVNPLVGDPFQDHFIDTCTGLKGFLLLNYDTLNNITELSDFCLDEETGIMVSSETRTGFVLSETSAFGRAYEILETGDSKHTRVRVGLGNGHSCSDSFMEHSVEYNIPDGKLNRHSETGYMYGIGYTVSQPFRSAMPIREIDGAILSIRNFSTRRTSTPTTGSIRLPSGADLRGVVHTSGKRGEYKIERGNGTWVGDAAGEIDLSVDDDGNVLGAGSFEAKNHRLVGHEPHEWVSMSGKIPYMRGHLFGENGEMLSAYGIVRGSYVDASGKVHQFEASAIFNVCADT